MYIHTRNGDLYVHTHIVDHRWHCCGFNSPSSPSATFCRHIYTNIHWLHICSRTLMIACDIMVGAAHLPLFLLLPLDLYVHTHISGKYIHTYMGGICIYTHTFMLIITGDIVVCAAHPAPLLLLPVDIYIYTHKWKHIYKHTLMITGDIVVRTAHPAPLLLLPVNMYIHTYICNMHIQAHWWLQVTLLWMKLTWLPFFYFPSTYMYTHILVTWIYTRTFMIGDIVVSAAHLAPLLLLPLEARAAKGGIPEFLSLSLSRSRSRSRSIFLSLSVSLPPSFERAHSRSLSISLSFSLSLARSLVLWTSI